MQTQEIIALPTTNKLQTYTIAIRQRSTLGAVANENIIQSQVEIKLLYPSKIGNVYEVQIKDRKQSNVEGIRAIENDLSFLQKKLNIQTNSNGLPVAILNLDEINEAWKKYKKPFKKAHKKHENIEELITETSALLKDNKTFVATFIESEIGTLFFPPVHGELDEMGKEVSESKTFQSFFGAVDLPLKLTNIIKKEKGIKGKKQLLRKGEIDTEVFDHYSVRKQFRKLADNLQLAVPVDTKYLETYDMDDIYGIQHAGQILSVQIEGLFSYEQIVRITPIKE
ncbi:hypothetical protein [Aquimarina algiphila]|uniref:hypothetical protein n=1 Tax=Aquimarina algiphila TaxID=2047982 RepID=UPI00232C6E4B|nr:hypothetical protein [Aquimarina algiphila]